MKTYTKADVQTRSGRPAVNVKVRGCWRRVSLPLDFGRFSDDNGATWQRSISHPAFTHDAAEPLMESHGDAAFESVCQSFWESAGDVATWTFKRPVKVYSEGRSGGWCVVHGLPDVESWDAVMLARWRSFENWCEAQAEDAPRAMLDWMYSNVWDVNNQNGEAEAAERLIAEGGAK